jgi:FecR protein
VVHLREGSALFDVARVRGSPVRVVVPGGAIVVIGTRFRVEVDRTGGNVELFEGRLEFHADDGSVTPIVAGQQLAFGARRFVPPPPAAIAPEAAQDEEPTILDDAPAEAPAATVAPRRRTHRDGAPSRIAAPVEPVRSAAEIIDDVRTLRHRGDYEGAAGRLRDALEQPWPRRAAEVLSYELGTILARHLHDVEGACHHWRAHLQRFGNGPRRAPIEASLASLGCD